MREVKWELGEVIWFDEFGGQGQLRSKSGETFYFHYSAIETKSKWKSIKADKKVKFKPSIDPTRAHASKVREL